MNTRLKLYSKAIGMLVGMIFGAGIFALPYAFARAGLFWALVHFVIALFFMLTLQLFYGEVAYLTKEKHRFTGYVRELIGEKYEKWAFFTTIFAYYGALLAYGILGGVFISNLFNVSTFNASVIFFVAVGLLSFFNYEKIASINFYLTIPLFIFVVYLFGTALPEIKTSNFLSVVSGNWFLPYGVWVFSLSGFAVIPEVKDILYGLELKDIKRVISISVLTTALFYFIFVFAIWGVSGAGTTEDAISGFVENVDHYSLLVGSIIGFLAVFTSFLAMAADLINIYRIDYRRNILFSWGMTTLIPLGFFVLGASSFVKTISVVGAIGLGISGIFIVEMARRLHKNLPEHHHLLLGAKARMRWILIIGLALGVFLEIYTIFVK